MTDTTPIIINLLLQQPTEEVRRTTFNCMRVGFGSCGDKTSYEICDGISDLNHEQREVVLRMIRRYRREIGKTNIGMVN